MLSTSKFATEIKVSQWRKITIIFEWFIVLMWKYLNFQLFCFCYSVVNVGSAFTEAQPGSSLTALCFEIVCLLLRKIVKRGFQILTLMNFHEPLEIKYNFQRPSSSKSPLRNFWKFLSRKEEVVLLKIGLVNRTQKKPNDVNQSSQQAVTLWTEFQNKTQWNYGVFYSL